MKRVELLAVLKKIEPALAKSGPYPVLTHFLFRDGAVLAYDDALALVREFKLGTFQGCVPGKLLTDFLGATSADEVDLVESDGATSVALKAGRSRVELATLPADDHPFREPATDEAVQLDVPEGFVSALAKASVSMGEDSLQQGFFGVTLHAQVGKDARLLSTNRLAVTQVSLGKVDHDLKEILPPRFVDVFIRLASKAPVKKLLFWEGDTIGAHFEDGTRMFCRTTANANPDEFDAIFSKFADEGETFPVPTMLDAGLARARLFLSSAVLSERVAEFKVAKERLSIEVRNERGALRDSWKFPGHPDVLVRAVPELLMPAVPHARSIRFSDGCVRLVGPGCSFLIAVQQ